MKWAVCGLGVAVSALQLAWTHDSPALVLAGFGLAAAILSLLTAPAATLVAAIAIGQTAYTRPGLADTIAVAVVLALLLAAADIAESHGGPAAIGAHFGPVLVGIVGAAVLAAIGRLPAFHGWPSAGVALCGIAAAGAILWWSTGTVHRPR